MTRALIFDCDGVLADTERDGHRVAFNQAFAEFDLPITWDDETYARLVKIGGGKERIASVLTPELLRHAGLNVDEAQRQQLIRDLHQRKTALFQHRIHSGAIPSRTGVARLINEALNANIRVAVASTSAPQSVRSVLIHAVGEQLANEIPVFAGDIVARKKPAPDIYLHALAELGIGSAEAIAVEDSHVGATAAHQAGMQVLVTVASYTRNEDFTGAALVVDHLGHTNQPATALHDPHGLMTGHSIIDMEVIEAIYALSRQ
ncbi:HAD-IA family hydrolase [Schaalia suimastitidis]|uniref:HAD-IA family hydrolase n=1 Tax=Schaalia suimastitidis TaxID=121163 RepID=UPI00040A5051|nr:HAD-IA family hydrolase [Schaalia suimastitidis]